MTDYTKITNYAIKDTLPSGDPAKIIRGTEFNVEFQAIEDAMGTKANAHDSVLTGDTTIESVTVTDTLIVNGVTVTGDSTFTGDITYSGANITYTGDTVTVEGDLIVGTTNINDLLTNTQAGGALNRPYRYWRINELTEQAGVSSLSINEIKLELGNVAVQSSATVSDDLNTVNITRLNDDNTSLTVAFGSLTEIVWDFGEGSPQALDTIYQFPDDGINPNGLASFTVSASDDGVSWIRLNSFTDLTPTNGQYSAGYRIFNLGEAPADGTVYGRKDRDWVPISGGGWTYDYTVKTADFTATAGTFHFVDATSGTVIVTLPASPSVGDRVGVAVAERGPVNEVILSGWPTLVMGSAIGFPLSGANGGICASTLIYVNATYGWVFDSSAIMAEIIE